MTRKDYVLIAAALKTQRDYLTRFGADNESDLITGIDTAILAVNNALARDNPAFVSTRFLAAANYRSKP